MTKGKLTKSPQAVKPHTRYYVDGELVPGVTTIINQLGWNKNMLIAWARREALAGRDPNRVRDRAADIGTCAHYLIQSEILGLEPDLSDYSPAVLDKAETAYIAWLEWTSANHIIPLGTEIELVSREYRYGGTIDIPARVNGTLGIIDLKSGSGIYPEHRIQLAAYGRLFREAFDLEGWPEFHLVRIDRDTGEFEHHHYQDLSTEWEVFKHCLELYRLQRKMKAGR